jgi:hypothetical protein
MIKTVSSVNIRQENLIPCNGVSAGCHALTLAGYNIAFFNMCLPVCLP